MRAFSQRLQRAVDYRREMREAMHQLYAENYSLEQIQKLIEFWSSPIGRKVYRLGPILTEERRKRGAGVFREPLMRISREVIEEESRQILIGKRED